MSYYNTTATHTTTGVKTISPGFTPKGYRITVSAKGGESYSHMSIGQVDDSGYATYHSWYQDTTNGSTQKGASGSSGKVVSILERVSGTISEVGAATHDSFTSTAIKYNVTTANSSYQYNVEVWD